ncbi:hypothetical protein SAMN02745664_1421, partial [Moraxella cuniculi DSM 21768]
GRVGVEWNQGLILHGGALGEPNGVDVLRGTITGLMFDSNFDLTLNPKINYDGIGNNDPQAGVDLANKFSHSTGQPKVLAGYSVGGDAALRAGSPFGGGKWDLRVIAGARVNTSDGVDFVERLEINSGNSKRVIVVGIVGDINLANDGVPSVIGAPFGDRSYEAIVRAINRRHGSLNNFYAKFPNVIIQPSFGAHGGGGNSQEMQKAIIEGYKRLNARGIPR